SPADCSPLPSEKKKKTPARSTTTQLPKKHNTPPHHPPRCCHPPTTTADMHAQGKPTFTLIAFRQNNPRPEKNRTAMKACQKIRLNLDVPYIRVFRRMLLGRNDILQLQIHCPALTGIQMDIFDIAVFVTRSVR